MILFNKGIATSPFLQQHASIYAILVVQMVFAVLLLNMRYTSLSTMDVDERIAKHILPYALLFCISLVSRLQSLTRISIPTFIIVQNIQMPYSQTTTIVSLVILNLYGVFLYVSSDSEIANNYQGYAWALIHLFTSMVMDFVQQHHVNRNLKQIKPEILLWYNHVMSIAMILFLLTIFFALDVSLSTPPAQTALLELQEQTNSSNMYYIYPCALLLLSSLWNYLYYTNASAVAETFVQFTTAYWWLTLNYISKILLVVFSVFFWNILLDPAQLFGLSFSFAAAYFQELSVQNILSPTIQRSLLFLFLVVVAISTVFILEPEP